MDYKGAGYDRIISFKRSFHGINGYGGMYTDRFEPVNQRLKGFPGSKWKPFESPVVEYVDGSVAIDEPRVSKVLFDIENVLHSTNNVCGILIEPIQCTFGDRYYPELFFSGIRKIATKFDVPLIFDEIQVGFGSTGKLWYFEHTSIEPDILVFGKKTQLSGIAVREKFSAIFKNAIRLEVTWDADIMDMIRCKYIIQAYEDNNVLENVNHMAKRLRTGLLKIPGIINLRNTGLMFAFDFAEGDQRDKFLRSVLENGMLCNPTRKRTIRLRPNLFVSKDEVDLSLSIMESAANSV